MLDTESLSAKGDDIDGDDDLSIGRFGSDRGAVVWVSGAAIVSSILSDGDCGLTPSILRESLDCAPFSSGAEGDWLS